MFQNRNPRTGLGDIERAWTIRAEAPIRAAEIAQKVASGEYELSIPDTPENRAMVANQFVEQAIQSAQWLQADQAQGILYSTQPTGDLPADDYSWMPGQNPTVDQALAEIAYTQTQIPDAPAFESAQFEQVSSRAPDIFDAVELTTAAPTPAANPVQTYTAPPPPVSTVRPGPALTPAPVSLVDVLLGDRDPVTGLPTKTPTYISAGNGGGGGMQIQDAGASNDDYSYTGQKPPVSPWLIGGVALAAYFLLVKESK